MPFSIEFVDEHAVCGRRSRAKLPFEAGPGLGVLAQITGLRHLWACVVSSCLPRNPRPV